jgi:hypothetical protein
LTDVLQVARGDKTAIDAQPIISPDILNRGGNILSTPLSYIPQIVTDSIERLVGNEHGLVRIMGDAGTQSKAGANLNLLSTTKWQFDAMNPGPLPDGVAQTFFGGKYSEGVVPDGGTLKVWRAGTIENPRGSFFTFDPPVSKELVRIDSAVKPQWIDKTGSLTGESPMDSVISLELKPGEKYYYGPVSYQGGIHMGGNDRIQIFVPDARNKTIADFKIEQPLQ